MHFLVFFVFGLVLLIVMIGIRYAVSSAKARKILHQAEELEKQGNFQDAATHYKKLILAVAANEQEVPMWLGRLNAVYEKMGIQAKTEEVVQTHKTIVDIWKSKMSDSEKRNLNKSAMESLKTQLDALP